MYPNDTSLQVNSCPNLLVMEDGVLQLYNTNIPKVNDNPKTFFNMEDYSIYSQSLIDHGINCPVLFVQSINDSQGKIAYKISPQPTLTNDFVYDTQQTQQKLFSVDPLGMSNGKYTEIDMQHDASKNNGGISDNPKDPNWGGVYHTQQVVDSGKYDMNEVGKPIMNQGQ